MGKRLTVALAVFAFLAVLLGTYTLGYFWLGKYVELDLSDSARPAGVVLIERVYPQQWMKVAFRPAAKAENWLRGVLVVVTCSGDHDPDS